jgi:hypothetical protein
VGWRTALIQLILGLLTTGLAAQEGGQPWLVGEPGPRGAAMGGASSLEEGPGLPSDPAQLAWPDPGILLSHKGLPFNTRIETFSAALALPKGWGGLSLGVDLADFGEQEATDEEGRVRGSIQAQAQALGLAWGLPLLDGLGLGAELKAGRLSWGEGEQNDLAWGLGLMSHHIKDLGVGICAKSSGSGQVWRMQAGLDWQALGGWAPLTLALSADSVSQGPTGMGVGAELAPGKARLRLGWCFSWPGPAGVEERQGPTLGAGWLLDELELNYAWLDHGDLGAMHRASLVWRWTEPVVKGAQGPGAARVQLASSSSAPPMIPAMLSPVPSPLPTPRTPTAFATRARIATSLPTSTVTASRTPTPWIQVDPGMVHAVLSERAALALRLHQEGKAAEALSAYQACSAADPSEAFCWRGQARLLRALGRASDAQRAWQRVFKLIPGDAEASSALGGQR